jgi:acyl carrier protein
MDREILSRVQRIMADIFSIPVERIRPESSPETIEAWDSVQHVNLMLALEQEFGLVITPEEIERLVSIHEIVTFVSENPPAGRSV